MTIHQTCVNDGSRDSGEVGGIDGREYRGVD